MLLFGAAPSPTILIILDVPMPTSCESTLQPDCLANDDDGDDYYGGDDDHGHGDGDVDDYDEDEDEYHDDGDTLDNDDNDDDDDDDAGEDDNDNDEDYDDDDNDGYDFPMSDDFPSFCFVVFFCLWKDSYDGYIHSTNPFC